MAKAPLSKNNSLLSKLSKADFGLIAPDLEAVEMPRRFELETRRMRVQSVFFVDSGLASVVGNGVQTIEVGLFGREGMSGLSVVLSNESFAPYQTFMQIGGNGRRLSADSLRNAIKRSTALHGVILEFAHDFMVLTAQSAVANARNKLEVRLARWLLMAHDRIDGDRLALTHEFLSYMLGVRRPGVTVAMQALERQNLISTGRGKITVLDREGLEAASNGAYEARADKPAM